MDLCAWEGWEREADLSAYSVNQAKDGKNYSAEFSVWVRNQALILLIDTKGTFEDQRDMMAYLARFQAVIKTISDLFPEHQLFLIQNYLDFDPTKFWKEIAKHAKQWRVKQALEKLPFDRQFRVGENPFTEPPFSELAFEKSLDDAVERVEAVLEELKS